MLISKYAIRTQFDQYRRGMSEQSLSRCTMQCYLSRASQFVEFLLASKVDPVDVEEEGKRYCNVLLEESYAPSSVNAFLTVIETFLSQLTNKRVKLPRIELKETEGPVLSGQDQVRFLATIDSESSLLSRAPISSRDRLLLLLLFHTGISIRQLVELNVEDLFVTPGMGKIITHPHVNKTAGSIFGEEFVTLNAQTKRAAEQWIAERQASGSTDDPALFINSKGQRITSAGAGHLVKRFGWKIQMELSGTILRNTYQLNRVVDAPAEPGWTALAAAIEELTASAAAAAAAEARSKPEKKWSEM